MGCCDDPTEPVKINRTDVARIQEQYGNLVRDLFTSDPEKVMLKQLKEANVYLRELAALNAYYASVRKQAIELLEKDSIPILQRIIDKEPESEISQYALQRVEYLKADRGLLGKIFN
jgi:oligoribonuclease NrnB/cAMP/cGMP phosphodiesterase (DHH superfamily)